MRLLFPRCLAPMVTLLVGMVVAEAPVHAAADDGTRPGPRSAGQLYQQVCARCHDTGIGPVLRGRSLSPPVTEALVRSGRAGMPAFRESEISVPELAALSAHVQALPAAEAAR